VRKGEGSIDRLLAGWPVLAVVAIGAFAVSVFVPTEPDRAMLVGAGTAMAAIGSAMVLLRRLKDWDAQRRLRDAMSFAEFDPMPSFCTATSGVIVAQNKAAANRFGPKPAPSITRVLDVILANPDALVHRMSRRVVASGQAREDVVTRQGNVAVSCHALPGGFLWRVEVGVRGAVPGSGPFPMPMVSTSPSGAIMSMNQSMRRLIDRNVRYLEDVFDGVPLENGGAVRMTGADGSMLVRTVVSRNEAGGQDVIVFPVGHGSEERVALDCLPVALLRLDEAGCITFANYEARVLLPLGEGDETRTLASLVEGLGRSADDWLREALEGRNHDTSEVVRVRGAETETFLQITLGRALEESGTGLIAVLSDATELKTMEAQFVQSQKMQAIGQLAGGVAHDFNNLLTAISGHCDLLLLRHDAGDEDHADLMQITQNANRAAALVGQLLAFSRKQTLKMQQIDLRDTLADLSHLLNRLVGERVQLVTEHDPALLPIRGDRRQLEQVLMNLVVNARDAMPDGGEIRIETGCRYLERPMRRDRVTVPVGQYVVVSVSDHGCGIPSDLLPRIFEPFVTTKRPGEGTGLGLSMVYGIVKQSGGFIFAESTVGRGTRFEIYLPVDTSSNRTGTGDGPDDARLSDHPVSADGQVPAILWPATRPGERSEPGDQGAGDRVVEEAGAAANRAERVAAPSDDGDPVDDRAPGTGEDTEVPAGRPKRILLVEDEAPVRAFAIRALRMKGYDLLEAANAEEALKILSDETVEVDLFVTDVMMPGLDGPTWVAQALEGRPKVRTIFMSGYAQEALARSPIPTSDAQFLAKPFSLSELTQTVERALA
jgi:two-component system cell cycle sensor histidine kinase/response regulator CckA